MNEESSMSFQIMPAIDLMDGACVRLQQGDANRKTRYPLPPAQVAADYAAAGVKRIHVVDLDGAFGGEPKYLQAIRDIRSAAPGVEIEVGGGIRNAETVATLFDAGINYAVIGTKALEDLEFLGQMIDQHGGKIIVGADARDGKLSTRGWTVDSNIEAVPYLAKLRRELGLETVIFTDIARDGMFTAPNTEAYLDLLKISGLKVIASGGVGTLQHVTDLADLNNPDLLGVIVGKALYDGRLSLTEAVAALS
jgi:phosphoribosylformimino-5-aminoimidazole carboxamide ribotide isomerase